MYKPDLASMFQQDISELDQLEISQSLLEFLIPEFKCVFITAAVVGVKAKSSRGQL